MTKTHITVPDHLKSDVVANIAAQFLTRCQQDPELENVSDIRVLKYKANRHSVLSGCLGTQAVIFRFFPKERIRIAKREWAEMQRIWPYLNDGDCRICRPLYLSADKRILVVENIKGILLLKHIQNAEPDLSITCINHCARWLRTYTFPTEDWQDNDYTYWLDRAEKAMERQSFADIRVLQKSILNDLKRIGKLIEKQKWRTAICHGDFQLKNLIMQGKTLVGIDTGGSAKLPIYRDIARLLAQSGRHGILPGTERYLGVSRASIQAFSQAFSFNQPEENLILPFMLGCEAILRVEPVTISSTRLNYSVNMYHSLAHDLSEIRE